MSKSKIEKFMQERGKQLKPVKEKKKGKLYAAERNELIDQMLKDLGYIE